MGIGSKEIFELFSKFSPEIFFFKLYNLVISELLRQYSIIQMAKKNPFLSSTYHYCKVTKIESCMTWKKQH